MKEVVIVDAVRTPVGNHGGAFRDLAPQQLAATAIKGLLERTKIDPALIDGKRSVGPHPRPALWASRSHATQCANERGEHAAAAKRLPPLSRRALFTPGEGVGG